MTGVVIPNRNSAQTLGCSCEWTSDELIRRFDRRCPILARHQFKTDGIVEFTDRTIWVSGMTPQELPALFASKRWQESV